MSFGPAAILGGAEVLGGLLGFAGQNSANSTNIALQKSQQDWEERMSNTSYQRQVKDLAAAGLNPMLGYMQGHGASTPDVAPARVENAGRFAGEGVSRGVSSALDAYMKQAQKTAIDVQNVKTRNEADLALASADKTRSEKALIDNQAGQVVGEAQARIKQNVASAGQAEAEVRKLGVDVESLKATIARTAAETAGVKLNNQLVAATMGAVVKLRRAEAGAQGAKSDVMVGAQSVFDTLKGIGVSLGYGVDAMSAYVRNLAKNLGSRYERAGRRYDFQMRGVQ
ncbi:MAG: DNA pilot protein [Microvirus sp.]|nr:MAG: DNA pilot protein [Microvirus sp.]